MELHHLRPDKLLEHHLYRCIGAEQGKGNLHLDGFPWCSVDQLAVNHRFPGGVIDIHGGCLQCGAVLNAGFDDGPEVCGILLAGVGEIQGEDHGILSVGILHDARPPVLKLAILQLQQIQSRRCPGFAPGGEGKQHQGCQKAAQSFLCCLFHKSLPWVWGRNWPMAGGQKAIPAESGGQCLGSGSFPGGVLSPPPHRRSIRSSRWHPGWWWHRSRGR